MSDHDAALLLAPAGDGGPSVSKGRMRAIPDEADTLPTFETRPVPSSDPTASGHLLPRAREGTRGIDVLKLVSALIALAAFYTAAVILGFALLVILFKAGLLASLTVLFFRGLALGGIVFVVTIGLLLLATARWSSAGLSARDCFGAAVLSLSFNICFLVVVPVTVDRSVSVFVLGEMNANPDHAYTADAMSALFTSVYTDDYRQIDRRLHEQALIGNVERTGETYRISQRGRVFIQISKWVAWLFDSDTRLVTPPSEPSKIGPPPRSSL